MSLALSIHTCTHIYAYTCIFICTKRHTYTAMHMHTCRYTHSNCKLESSVFLSGEPHGYYSPNLSDPLPSMCMGPGQGWGLLKSSERGQLDSEADGICPGRPHSAHWPAAGPNSHAVYMWSDETRCILSVSSDPAYGVWEVTLPLDLEITGFVFTLKGHWPEVGCRKAAHYCISIKITLPSVLGLSPQGGSWA